MKFFCICPNCQQYEFEEAKFRSCLDPDSSAKLDERISAIPAGSEAETEAIIVFTPHCPRCQPELAHDVRLIFKKPTDENPQGQ